MCHPIYASFHVCVLDDEGSWFGVRGSGLNGSMVVPFLVPGPRDAVVVVDWIDSG